VTTHQEAAINSIMREGRDTVIATATASGKSLCYNAPVLQTLALDPTATALYLFPTKALAQVE
jgi:DEAD/DEAH box helicase domain-containing protein